MINVKVGMSPAKLEQLLGPGSEVSADYCRLYVESTLARHYSNANVRVSWYTDNKIFGVIRITTDVDDDWVAGEAIGSDIDYAVTAALEEAIKNCKTKPFR
jgi:hypothetical protein